jgi:hypothetical protein
MANLLEMMPETFSRKEMFAISQSIKISLRTIDNYLTDYLNDNKIECIEHGIYRKTAVRVFYSRRMHTVLSTC